MSSIQNPDVVIFNSPPGVQDLSRSSSLEEPAIKTKKKYKLTKRREYWSDEEHRKFVVALAKFGREWKRIEKEIETKTAIQIRSHAQKYFIRLQKAQSDKLQSIPPPRSRKPRSPDTEGEMNNPTSGNKDSALFHLHDARTNSFMTRVFSSSTVSSEKTTPEYDHNHVSTPYNSVDQKLLKEHLSNPPDFTFTEEELIAAQRILSLYNASKTRAKHTE